MKTYFLGTHFYRAIGSEFIYMKTEIEKETPKAYFVRVRQCLANPYTGEINLFNKVGTFGWISKSLTHIIEKNGFKILLTREFGDIEDAYSYNWRATDKGIKEAGLPFISIFGPKGLSLDTKGWNYFENLILNDYVETEEHRSFKINYLGPYGWVAKEVKELELKEETKAQAKGLQNFVANIILL
jgi:hypothetical protein